jgi:hypothetical protein
MRSYEGSCVAGIVIRSWRWRNGRPGIVVQLGIVRLGARARADLAVSSNEKPPFAGVDTELGKVIDFNFLSSV